MIDSFAAPDSGQHVVFFGPSLGRDDQSDVLADGFSGAVAEYSLGAGIPRGDHAVERFADDYVIRRCDNRSKVRGNIGGSVRFAQLLFRPSIPAFIIFPLALETRAVDCARGIPARRKPSRRQTIGSSRPSSAFPFLQELDPTCAWPATRYFQTGP